MGFLNVVFVGILLFTIVADWGDRAYAASAVALFWGTPPVWTIGFAQVADVLVAYCVLAVFAVLASQLPGNSLTRLPAALGGFCLGLLCWSKMEGVPLALALMGGTAVIWWTSRHRSGTRRGELGMIAAAALPVSSPCWCSDAIGCGTVPQTGPWWVLEFSPRPHRALVDAAARNS